MLKGEAWVTSPWRRRRDAALATAMLAPGGAVIGTGLMLSRLLDGPHPLYAQERAGKDGRPITIRKIRTMPGETRNIPSLGADDPRASKFGQIIRRLGIDEAPQLYNVLKGELAVFGPRVQLEAEIEAMSDNLPAPLFERWYEVYNTGPGCVSSFAHLVHGEQAEQNNLYVARARADIADFEQASPVNDMKLLAKVAKTAMGAF